MQWKYWDEFHYLFICKSPELVRIRENIIPEYYTRCSNKQKLSGLLSYCNVNLYKKVSSFIKKLNNILWNINVLCLFILTYLILDIVNIFYVIHILWNIIVLYLCTCSFRHFMFNIIYLPHVTHVSERCLIKSWERKKSWKYVRPRLLSYWQSATVKFCRRKGSCKTSTKMDSYQSRICEADGV